MNVQRKQKEARQVLTILGVIYTVCVYHWH